MLAAGLVIASLGGGELALREHLGGYRSHSSLLAGVAAFVVVTVVALGFGPVQVWVLLVLGAGVFAGTFYAMREVFKRGPAGSGSGERAAGCGSPGSTTSLSSWQTPSARSGSTGTCSACGSWSRR